MRALLDTSVVIRLLRSPQALAAVMAAVDDAFVSVVTVGELLVGQANTQQPLDIDIMLSKVGQAVTVIDVNAAVAHQFARIESVTRKAGRPRPQNDVWIAATAVEYGLTVLTFDRHFDDMPGLRYAVLK